MFSSQTQVSYREPRGYRVPFLFCSLFVARTPSSIDVRQIYLFSEHLTFSSFDMVFFVFDESDAYTKHSDLRRAAKKGYTSVPVYT